MQMVSFVKSCFLEKESCHQFVVCWVRPENSTNKAKARISLSIHAVRSGTSLSDYKIIEL